MNTVYNEYELDVHDMGGFIDCCITADNEWFRYRTGAIIVEDGKALFIKSGGCDYLYTVGGGVHIGETAQDCVCREVFEETGVRYEIERLAVVCENFFKETYGKIKGFDCHCLELYFVMKSRGEINTDSCSYNSNGDKEKLEWIPIDRIMDYNVKPSFLKQRLADIVSGRDIIHIVDRTDADTHTTADKFGSITRYLPIISEVSFKKWVYDNANDGQPEHTVNVSLPDYSQTIKSFIDDIYRYMDDNKEMELNCYSGIMERYGIARNIDSMCNADVKNLDGQGIMSLILGAVRSERFCDGSLLSFFKNGSIIKWLERLKQIDDAV